MFRVPLLNLGGLRTPLAVGILWSLLATFPASAGEAPSRSETEISVTLQQPAGEATRASLRLREETGAEQILDVQLPWRGRMSYLPPAWLQVEASGFWAPELFLDGSPALADIAVWPAAEVRGSWAVGSLDPPSLQVSFQPPRLSAQEKPLENPSGASICSLGERTFSCRLPAAALDLKMEAQGFVPLYFWNQPLKAERPLDLHSLNLEKGASVAGWVAVSPGIDPAQVEVALELATTGFQGDPVLGTQLARKSRKTGVDPRGFFQLKALEPGVFSIAARAPERPAGPSLPLQVKRDEELVLSSPLELPEAGRLRVFVEPGAQPWTFTILARKPGSQLETPVREGRPDTGGWLDLDGLPAGRFSYRVMDEAGGTWRSGELEILPGDNPPLLVEIPQIPVTGKVLLGKTPVAAKLTFGAMGDQQIPVHSDEEGLFEVSLPRAGRWELAAELPAAGYVRLDPVNIAMEGGELSLRIPGAGIEGRVFEDGKPRADALVLIKDRSGAGNRLLGTGITDAEGRFRTTGIDGGSHGILAKTTERQTDWIEIEVEEGEQLKDVRIDLPKSLQIRGRALAQGFPVPGAQIVAVPVPRRLGRASSLTDADGRFQLLLPADTAAATLIGLARGYGAAIEGIGLPAADRDLNLTTGFGDLRLLGLDCRPGTHTLVYGRARLDLFELFATLFSADLASEGANSLELNGLPPGPYQICEERSRQCSETYVTAGVETTLDLARASSEGNAP